MLSDRSPCLFVDAFVLRFLLFVRTNRFLLGTRWILASERYLFFVCIGRLLVGSLVLRAIRGGQCWVVVGRSMMICPEMATLVICLVFQSLTRLRAGVRNYVSKSSLIEISYSNTNDE
jgi:hypothetical protein